MHASGGRESATSNKKQIPLLFSPSQQSQTGRATPIETPHLAGLRILFVVGALKVGGVRVGGIERVPEVEALGALKDHKDVVLVVVVDRREAALTAHPQIHLVERHALNDKQNEFN